MIESAMGRLKSAAAVSLLLSSGSPASRQCAMGFALAGCV